MTEEYIYERERDLLDYFRNQMTDPESRGTDITQTGTGTGGQTTFTLNNTLVKNVADTITIAGSSLRKGYDYTVLYGEGNKTTSIIFNTAPGVVSVPIPYHYGSSMIEREFSRTDVKLPRVIFMFLTGSEEAMGLDDRMDSIRGVYFNASYRVEIRSRYAQQAREIASKAFNFGPKYRRACLYRVINASSYDMQNFDFDVEKDCYIWQFTLNIQWELPFE